MTAPNTDRQALVEANRREYGDDYATMSFPPAAAAAAAQARRQQLLDSLAARGVESGCHGTKLDCRQLSPGCRLCVAGVWSCLFINNRCNCRCFYCPTPQDQIGVPGTNNLDFPKPADYADYLARFGFRGVSLSGGEPLLTPERTLQYLTAVRQRLGDGAHLWLYTNGTLVTRDLLLQLRNAGLNEIRFDLGAIDYRLDPVRLAQGVIEHVTVEVPAVPEDLPLLRQRLAAMADSGVRYLNLHQMRLTPYNFKRLAGRGYTFLHGTKVTVLESELTALELMHHALDQQLPLGVNYCSFVYKNRYQALAARRRYAPLVQKGWEDITESGFLRALALVAAPEVLQRQAGVFAASGAPPEQWELARDWLNFSGRLLGQLEPAVEGVRLRYSEAALQPAVTYRHPFVEIPLNRERKVAVEKRRVGDEFELPPALVAALEQALRQQPAALPAAIASFEFIPRGLQDYY